MRIVPKGKKLAVCFVTCSLLATDICMERRSCACRCGTIQRGIGKRKDIRQRAKVLEGDEKTEAD